MNKKCLFAALSVLLLAACKSDSDKAMEKFLAPSPAVVTQGGLLRPNGDYAKYESVAEGDNLSLKLEVRRRGECRAGTATIPKKALEEKQKSYWTNYENVKIQYYPAGSLHNPEVKKFVHLWIDASVPTSSCTGEPTQRLTEKDYEKQLDRHIFSGLDVSDTQLQELSKISLRGSHQTVLLSRENKLGLIVRGDDEELLGLSVAKELLYAENLFGLNRDSNRVSTIPYDAFLPLLLSNAEIDLYFSLNELRRDIVRTQEREDLNPSEKEELINGFWTKQIKEIKERGEEL